MDFRGIFDSSSVEVGGLKREIAGGATPQQAISRRLMKLACEEPSLGASSREQSIPSYD
jgi:hypothetical protein